MSFNDEYLALRKKRQKEEEENKASFAPVRPLYVNKTAPLYVQDEDIAPVLTTTTKKDKDEDEKEERTFFKKGAFEDRYQFGDVAKTILGTGEDIKTNVGKGALKLVGGVADAVTYGVAGAADALEFDSFADKARKFAKKDIVDNVYKDQEEKIERYSVLGEKSDAVAEGLGQVGTIILTGGAAGALGVSATAATTVLTGASGIGSGMTEAYKGGATDEEAATYGVINGIVQAGSELIFGGLGKAVKAVGLSKGLTSIDDAFAQKLTEKITNRVVKNFVEYGVKASAEGAEEVIAGIGSAVGQKLTYMSDKELGELVKNQDLLEQFVIGSITSGIAQGYGLASSIGSDRDFITGLSANEQKVVDKEVENRVAEEEKEGKKLSNREKDKIREAVISDMEKGYISIDTIQEVLGGDTYKSYKDTTDSEEAILKEYEELGKKQNATLAEQDRFAELKAKIKEMQEGSQRNKLKSQLDDEVFGLVKKDRLVESYNERTKRGQAFAADVSKYDAKQQAIIQKAIDSGILNNTRRTHEFVDMIAKVSADKGVPFDFTNNERLKESGFAKDGKIVNGYVTKAGIVLNANSAKALNSVVGHEITHVLEGTELYGELQSVVAEYAKTKGEYQSRYDALAELYKDEDADIDAELTADLVGDYLFTDQDFVNNLSVKNRNVFQKVYDEIKYLCKVATAGSKEARDLEKVKRVFEKAYRDSGKAQEEQKFSLSDNAGKQLTAEQQEYFKDSKVRDKDGNLMVMYHGSQNAGFHVFDQRFSDDDTSFFFVDRNDVAATYSGTSEIYEAKSFRTAEDANKFFAEIGKPYYEVVEENGKFIFTENGDFIAESDTARGIYEEFCEWEGVGYGDANYKVYLNLKNPLVVDAKGRKWDELPGVNDDTQYEYIKIVDVGHLSGQVTIEYAINSDSAPVTETVDLYDKFPDNLADTLSDLSPGEGIKGIYVNPSTTREYSLHAKEQGYDGVIFNNIVDVGGYGNGNEGAATVAIAFNSNQIKSVANKKPTEDADIRYSLSKTDSKGRELSLAVQKWSGSSKVVDEDGGLVQPLAIELAPHALGPAGVGDGQMQTVGVDAVPVLGSDEVAQRILVAVLGGLGETGGAAGEEHQHSVLTAGGVLGADEFLREHPELVVKVVPALPAAVHHDLGHVGELPGGLLGLVGHIAVAGADHGADAGGLIAVLQVVGQHLVAGQQGHRADLVQAQDGEPELVVPLEDQQHPVAALDAQGLEVVGGLAGVAAHVGEGEVALLLAAVHVDHSQLVRLAPCQTVHDVECKVEAVRIFEVDLLQGTVLALLHRDELLPDPGLLLRRLRLRFALPLLGLDGGGGGALLAAQDDSVEHAVGAAGSDHAVGGGRVVVDDVAGV